MNRELNNELKGRYRDTLAANFLFKLDPNANLLSKEEKDKHHRTKVKCLSVSQYSRIDL